MVAAGSPIYDVTLVATMAVVMLLAMAVASRAFLRATRGGGGGGPAQEHEQDVSWLAFVGSGLLCCLYLAALCWALIICFARPGATSVDAAIPFIVLLGVLCLASAGATVRCHNRSSGSFTTRRLCCPAPASCTSPASPLEPRLTSRVVPRHPVSVLHLI